MKAIVRKKIDRPSPEWLDKFEQIPSSIISDCLNRYYAIGGEIRPIYRNIRLVGYALTIQSMSGNNIMSHFALTFAQPGDVLVVDARGCLGNSVWGEVQTEYAQMAGVRGLVVDGAIRDIEAMREKRFPVYCKGVTPAGPHKGWADNVNVPIQCGGVPVNPGDLILGDDDGVAVLPKLLIPVVYEEALNRMKMEEKWLQKIRSGQSSLDAVGLRSILENMDMEIIEDLEGK